MDRFYKGAKFTILTAFEENKKYSQKFEQWAIKNKEWSKKNYKKIKGLAILMTIIILI